MVKDESHGEKLGEGKRGTEWKRGTEQFVKTKSRAICLLLWLGNLGNDRRDVLFVCNRPRISASQVFRECRVHGGSEGTAISCWQWPSWTLGENFHLLRTIFSRSSITSGGGKVQREGRVHIETFYTIRATNLPYCKFHRTEIWISSDERCRSTVWNCIKYDHRREENITRDNEITFPRIVNVHIYRSSPASYFTV